MPKGKNKGQIYHGETVTDLHDRSGLSLKWYKLEYNRKEYYYLSHKAYDFDAEVDFEIVKSQDSKKDDYAVFVKPA